jgi:DNA repair exonuclease SbcCD ATPase subunit
MPDVSRLRKIIEQRKGRRDQIRDSIVRIQQELKEKGKELRRHEEARVIIQEVALKTQKQLSYHISEITSLALNTIFPEPYALEADFIQRRNKTECDLFFVRNEERIDPLSASGGGAVDVAAFALRVASWSMQRPRSQNTLVLDEPFRYLSANLLPLAGEMLKQISERLKLQIIMVSHCEELIEAADKTFKVTIKKGVSTVSTND